MPGVDWASIGEVASEKYEKRENAIRQSKCYRKYQYSDLDSYKEIVNSGRIRYKSFEDATRFYFEHSPMRLGVLNEILTFLKSLLTPYSICKRSYLMHW